MSKEYICKLFSFLAITILLLANESNSNTVQLSSSNIDDIINSNDLVFVNFYADWCRFSQMLAPIFDDTAKKVVQEYPQAGKVIMGRVDCDKETGISSKYHVTKYPTLKLFRHGSLVKREYRGQRSVEAITNFIREQLEDIVNTVSNIDDIDSLSRKKRHIIGYFSNEGDEDYKVFQKVASKLREDCKFHAAIGEISEKERIAGNKIVFKPDSEQQADMLYSGRIAEEQILQAWSQDKCVPLVREITFENAEELTEEGLPFMILFHHTDDTQSAESYRRIVGRELVPDKNSVNFLVADGKRFAHPLHHLGKSESDLPVLAIDSFRHMYLWPHNAKADLEKSGLIKQFIADLHSGKLHREFHHGPDATQGDGEGGGTDLGQVIGQGMQQIQQQIVIHGNGMRLQVVRIVHMGGQPGQINLRDIINDPSNQIGMEQKDDSDKPDGEKPKDDFEEKLKAEFGKRFEADPDNPDKDDPDDEDTETKTQPPIETVKDDKEKPQDLRDEHAGNKIHKTDDNNDDNNDKDNDETTTTTKTTIIYKTIKQDKLDPNTSRSPPKSIFHRLRPSKHRYTMLKDEL